MVSIVLAFVISLVYISSNRAKEVCDDGFGCWLSDNFAIHYRNTTEDQIRINITLENYESGQSTYIALAFSDDQKMGDDEVVSCMIDSSLNMKLQHSKNVLVGRLKSNLPLYGEDKFTDIVKEYNEETKQLMCSFSRPITVTDAYSSEYYDLTKPCYLFVAIGQVADYAESKLSEHGKRFITDKKVNLLSPSKLKTDSESKGIIAAHGIFQIVAWCILAPISLFTARFYRPYFTSSYIVQKQKWFVLHIGLNLLTFLCCVAAIFLALFYENFVFSVNLHTVMGLIVFFLLVIQLLMGILRPDLSDQVWRDVFCWCHRFTGFLLCSLALVTAYFGIRMYNQKYSPSSVTEYFVIGLSVVYIAFWVFVVGFSKRVDASTSVTESSGKYIVQDDVLQVNVNSELDVADEIKTAFKRKTMVKVYYAFCIIVVILSVVLAFDLMTNLTGRSW